MCLCFQVFSFDRCDMGTRGGGVAGRGEVKKSILQVTYFLNGPIYEEDKDLINLVTSIKLAYAL